MHGALVAILSVLMAAGLGLAGFFYRSHTRWKKMAYLRRSVVQGLLIAIIFGWMIAVIPPPQKPEALFTESG